MDILELTYEQLCAIKVELQNKMANVELRISAIKGTSNLKKSSGRPKGSKNMNSLDSCVLKALGAHLDGLSYSNILRYVLEYGYKTSAEDNVFRNMLKSRLSCLKTQGIIKKDQKNLIYSLI